MKKQQQEMFVSKHDLESEIDKLTQAIRTANDANTRLNNCVDLFNLPSPQDLTTDWLHVYISSRTDAVSKNLCFDSLTQTRMIEGWEKIEKKVLPDVKSVERFCKKFKDQISYDEQSEMMVFNDVEQLAIGRVEKPLPEDCNTHIEMIDCIRNMVLKLRQWEKVHRCIKRPLEWLLKADKDTLKTEWAQGTILINDEEEAQDYNRTAKWMRQAAEQLIF